MISAPYDKFPSGARIISSIFMGKFTILFFLGVFSKLQEKVRLSFEDRLSCEVRFSFDCTKKLFQSFPGSESVRLSFDDRLSFDAYRLNVKTNSSVVKFSRALHAYLFSWRHIGGKEVCTESL